MRALVTGRGLTLLAAVVTYLLTRSPAATIAAAAFGLLATTIQYFASRSSAQVAPDAQFSAFVAAHGMGMGLRFGGVVVLMVVCSTWPAQFPALGAAIGYLGVLIPLLFLETRTTR